MQTTNFPVAEFENTKRMNPCWSTWTCFAEIIKGRSGISKRIITRYFDRLIDKDDYAKSEKSQLINYLEELKKS